MSLNLRKKILLIDDNQEICSLTARMSKRIGYDIIGLGSCEEALALFQKDTTAFDIIITDFSMPTMTGVQFAEKIKHYSEDTPVILSTGFADTQFTELLEEKVIDGILKKPYSLDDLEFILQQVSKASDCLL